MDSKEKVYFIVYNDETDEYEQLEMDADAYEAMCVEENRTYKEHEERMEELHRQDREDAYYAARREEAHERREYEAYVERMTQRPDDYED